MWHEHYLYSQCLVMVLNFSDVYLQAYLEVKV
jgi:hypothetical protein